MLDDVLWRRAPGLALVMLAALLALSVVACSRDETRGAAPTTAAVASQDDDGDVAAFCAEMSRLGGERPEAYVGSSEHVEDVEALGAVAPSRIRSDVEVYRAFLASGAAASDDPDSNLTENWPSAVQDAVARIMVYEDETC